MRLLWLAALLVLSGCDLSAREKQELEQERARTVARERLRKIEEERKQEEHRRDLITDRTRVLGPRPTSDFFQPLEGQAAAEAENRREEAVARERPGPGKSLPCDATRSKLRLVITDKVMKGCLGAWDKHAVALTERVTIELDGERAYDGFLDREGQFVSARTTPEGCALKLEFKLPEVGGGLSFELIDGAGVVNGTIWIWDRAVPRKCGHGVKVMGSRELVIAGPAR